ncbi:MAG TPA: hypothetical protein VM689_10160 [Aliidongia sp.]|nr:hypothetical protein [Aliidongia sp.]
MRLVAGLVVLGALAVIARPGCGAPMEHETSTSGISCSQPPAKLLASEKLICADQDLGKADGELSQAYYTLSKRLNEGGARALEQDHTFWFLSFGGGLDVRCNIAASRAVPASPKDYYAARACLLSELDERRAAIEALPAAKPDAPYLLSPFERIMLRGLAGNELYLRRLLDKHLSGDGALARALQRSLAAVLPPTRGNHFAWLDGNPYDQFVQSASVGSGTLTADRYFFYRSEASKDVSSQVAFVADLQTGEVSVAMLDPLPAGRPAMIIWEKACANHALKEFGRTQYPLLGADWSAQWRQEAGQLDQEIVQTPCR